MPIIKSAKKRVKQTAVRKARNYNTRTAVKKAIRIVGEAVKAGDKKAAEAALPAAYKIIDTAAKKNVLNSKTAARRKSTLAGLIANIETKKAAAKAEPKTATKKPAKKAAPKKEKVEATEAPATKEAPKEEAKAE